MKLIDREFRKHVLTYLFLYGLSSTAVVYACFGGNDAWLDQDDPEGN